MRVPKIDGLMMENPTKMNHLGVPPVQETSRYIIEIYIYIYSYIYNDIEIIYIYT